MMDSHRKTDGLLFKFAMVFLIFTIVTLALSGFMTYVSQMGSYKAQCQDRLKKVGHYLDSLIKIGGDDFRNYQDYFMENYHDMEIPIGFTDYREKEAEFYELLAEQEPGKIYGKDISFDDLTPELKKAFAEYMHEFYLLSFEKANEDFGLAYTYYLDLEKAEPGAVDQDGKPYDYSIYYVLDAERTEREGSDGKLLHLGDQYEHNYREHGIELGVWESGAETNEFQEWDNAWGHTYSYYVPLKISGEKMGLIVTEIDVEDVNQGILMNTLREIVGIATVLIFCVLVVLLFINNSYISKITRLSDYIGKYSMEKDPSIAKFIETNEKGKDEIADLANQTAAMILEIDNYIKSLRETTRELSETKEKANSMQALANRDALTGIRNKNAYDTEVLLLEASLEDGFTDFGIAMIDLNFLKKINDTYGHEQGNMAIKKLCHIVCVVFDHSPVFRIGGDEFVVILKGHDMKHYDELKGRFEHEIDLLENDESVPRWERVSAAIGAAFYDPSKDRDVASVFKRADEEMYYRKKEMKALRE